MIRAGTRLLPSISRIRRLENVRHVQIHRFFSTWDHKREVTPIQKKKVSLSQLEGIVENVAGDEVHHSNALAASISDENFIRSIESLPEGAEVVPLMNDDLHPYHDVNSDLDFNIVKDAQRLGFPYTPNEYVDEPQDEIREESRDIATVKAERVMSLFRRTLNERTTNTILRKLSLYTTNPKPNKYSVTKFFQGLESMMCDDHLIEYQYLRAFLCGKDSEQVAYDENALIHPSHELYEDLCAVILVHCRRACATTYIRHALKQPSSTLPTVKRQLKVLLESKGWLDMAPYCGLTYIPKQRIEPDSEWTALNLENDLVDFDRELDLARETIQFLRTEGRLSEHEIEKILSIMVAFVKNAKVHRNILQDLICEIQHAAPTHSQLHVNKWASVMVKYLSAERTTLTQIQSEEAYATDYVQYKQRNDAFLRLLLDARMRTSHIYIRGLDAEVLDKTLALKSETTRRALLTTALNLATVLDDRSFHAFYGRFVRHKLTWRSNFDTSEDIFLTDIMNGIPRHVPPACTAALINSLRQVHGDLTLEALSVCRLRVLNRGRLIRTRATVRPVSASHEDDEDQCDVNTTSDVMPLTEAWHKDRTVFYSNIPTQTKVENIRSAFQKIGAIRRLWIYQEPRAGLAPRLPSLVPNSDLDESDNDEDKGKEDTKRSRNRKKNKASEGNIDETFNSDLEDDEVVETKKHKFNHIVASERRSPIQCVVEYMDEVGQGKALHPALKIFGVMVTGEKEKRAVFGTPPDNRRVICIHSIPYCTTIRDVHLHIQRALSDELQIEFGEDALPHLFVTQGTLELQFDSYEQAAVVIERLTAYLESMPDPKHTEARVKKEKTTSTVKYRTITKAKREKRERDKEEDEARNTIPTVLLQYEDGQDINTYRPFEVSWASVPKRKSHLF